MRDSTSTASSAAAMRSATGSAPGSQAMWRVELGGIEAERAEFCGNEIGGVVADDHERAATLRGS